MGALPCCYNIKQKTAFTNPDSLAIILTARGIGSLAGISRDCRPSRLSAAISTCRLPKVDKYRLLLYNQNYR